MQIEIAKHERMSESGSSLLRLIQNTSTSRLDLLIRESLQNSLDAADGQSNYVGVNFKIGEFDATTLNSFFEGIKDKLNARYFGNYKYISIRDYNTSGLTGPIHFSEVQNNNFGNLLKLVYEISKAQENQGSGGSWGLGKTVYFRLGIGLVIYYSRIINESGQYESRLAAALVEDERTTDTLIPKLAGVPQRGIAWWGSPYNDVSTKPITDESEIKQILNVLGIKMYGSTQTGTTVIIPYVDEPELLKETLQSAQETESVPVSFQKSLQDYISIAVQRWYAPRLENSQYDGIYLHCTVNGKLLDYDSMAPVFRLIQCLYNANPKTDSVFGAKKIISKPIELRNIFCNTSVAGYINYIKVDAADMKMNVPYNYPNPYSYIGKYNFNNVANDPVILFVRKPGMIVSYELTGDWTDGIPKTGKADFIIGVFKANSSNIIKKNNMMLEEYLRKSEKADHMSWCDISKIDFRPNIVMKVQGHVRRKITADYGEISHGNSEHRNLGLGKRLADLLLPPSDFSSWDDSIGGESGDGGHGGEEKNNGGEVSPPKPNKKIKRPVLKAYGNLEFDNNEVRQDIQICFGKMNNVKLISLVLTESGAIRSEKWESEDFLDTPFPINVRGFILKKIYIAGKLKTTQKLCSSVEITVNKTVAFTDFVFINSNKYGVQQGIEITVPDNSGYVIEGTICYSLDNVRGILALENN